MVNLRENLIKIFLFVTELFWVTGTFETYYISKNKRICKNKHLNTIWNWTAKYTPQNANDKK